MPKIITLDDIKLVDWRVVIDDQCAIARYYFVDDAGKLFGDMQTAIFWVSIPNPGVDPLGNPLPVPDNWYQLPTKYLTTLMSINADLRTALLGLVTLL